MTKQTWATPVVEVLDVKETMAGSGGPNIDLYFTDHHFENTTDPVGPQPGGTYVIGKDPRS